MSDVRDEDVVLENGDHYLCDDLHGKPDIDRVKAILGRHGLATPENFEYLVRRGYAVVYNHSFLFGARLTIARDGRTNKGLRRRVLTLYREPVQTEVQAPQVVDEKVRQQAAALRDALNIFLAE